MIAAYAVFFLPAVLIFFIVLHTFVSGLLRVRVLLFSEQRGKHSLKPLRQTHLIKCFPVRRVFPLIRRKAPKRRVMLRSLFPTPIFTISRPRLGVTLAAGAMTRVFVLSADRSARRSGNGGTAGRTTIPSAHGSPERCPFPPRHRASASTASSSPPLSDTETLNNGKEPGGGIFAPRTPFRECRTPGLKISEGQKRHHVADEGYDGGTSQSGPFRVCWIVFLRLHVCVTLGYL